MTASFINSTRYRHDGQMGMEDEEWSADHLVTRYGLGARGVDMIERTSSTGTVTAFPLYDAHGNDVASLTRDGNGGYSLGDRRSYDAWGVVRSQQSGGDPRLRYCGSLGHKADDETGLVYMRARYYEPGSGRFVSEDSSGQGQNWFVYCGNSPLNGTDSSGKMFTLFDVGFTMTEFMRTRASQAAALATALSKCGDKVASTMAKYNFRMDMLMWIETADADIVDANASSFDEAEQALMVGNWDKVYGAFTGTDPMTGDSFDLLIHWFQEKGTSNVGDVKVIGVDW